MGSVGDLNPVLTFGVMESDRYGRAAPKMVYAFDTLGYAKHLRDAGVSPEHAEAHAEAAREFVMGELVTRHDLEISTTLLKRGFEASIAGLRRDFETLRSERQRLELRLIIRLGGMLAMGITILAAIIKL